MKSLPENTAIARKGYIRVTEALSVIRNAGYEEFEKAVGKARAGFVLDEKGMIGTQVHYLCKRFNEARITKTPFSLSDAAASGEFLLTSLHLTENYIRWVDQFVEEILYAEQKVFFDKYRYRGTLDVILRMKGDKGISLIDLKCTDLISPTVKLQLAAYRKAFESEHEERIDRMFALRLSEDNPKPKPMEYADPDKWFRLFLYAVDLKQNL